LRKNSMTFALIGLMVTAGSLTWSIVNSVTHAAEAGAGQAQVIFHRPDVMKGRAVRFNISQNGQPIGQLSGGTKIELALDPGTYTFVVSAVSLDGQDSITLNVESGKTYQIRGEVLWGWPVGRPKFTDVTESEIAASRLAASPKRAEPGMTSTATSGGQSTVASEEAGRIGLRNFAGDWNMRMWSLTSDGNELEARGVAQGVLEGNDQVRITLTEFDAPDFPEPTVRAEAILKFEKGKGFILEVHRGRDGEILRLTGSFQMDSNSYTFYLIGGSSGQTITGIDRNSVRLEIRTLDRRSWVADTFAHVDGQSTQVQSTRFSRRSLSMLRDSN
jgi:hypothetical protein